MFNPIAYGTEVQPITASVTLGYGPGQTAPPRELVLNTAAALTVVLPPINSQLPVPPGVAQTIVGVGNGFQITFHGTTTFVPTITPYSAAGFTTDVIADALTLNTNGAVQTLIANADNGTWYKMGN